MTISHNQRKGAAWITGLSAGFFLAARYFYPVVPAVTQWVVVWAAVESLAAFYSLSWAFHKSDTVFFGFFVGGTLFRLSSMGVLAAILYIQNIPLLIPLLTLGFLYFVFSLLQVPYIAYGLW